MLYQHSKNESHCETFYSHLFTPSLILWSCAKHGAMLDQSTLSVLHIQSVKCLTPSRRNRLTLELVTALPELLWPTTSAEIVHKFSAVRYSQKIVQICATSHKTATTCSWLPCGQDFCNRYSKAAYKISNHQLPHTCSSASMPVVA